MKGYSYTSNEVKLFKHLDNLKAFQRGKGKPVLFHISPTNKCNMGCSHCCFSSRDRQDELDYDKLVQALYDMKDLGVKSIEWTGGGEPTLYKYLPEATQLARALGFRVGMNTNAINYRKDLDYSLFDWVRVSMNAFDLDIDLTQWENNVLSIKEQTKVTACYIATVSMTFEKFEEVATFAQKYQIYTRVAPDCIKPKDEIEALIEWINDCYNALDSSDYLFVSDFNIFLGERKNNFCAMHYLKPFLFSDGYVYPCPSSELAVENGRTVPKEFRLCRMEQLKEFFMAGNIIKRHACSYCKYTNQNNILQNLLEDVEDDKFC